MAHSIHARYTDHDGVKFRVWSTITDSYLTKELSESELRAWFIAEAVTKVTEQQNKIISARIQRALQRGTSASDEKQNKYGPWEKELK